MGEASQMSEMSGTESSQMSTVEGGGKSEGSGAITGIIILLVIIGIGATVAYGLLSGSDTVDEPSPDAVPGGGGGEGGGGTPSSPPNRSPPTVAPSGLLPLANLLPRVENLLELVCTVGRSAVVESMYPPDKFCDYLYYCDIAITSEGLTGAIVQTSWESFQKKAQSYQNMKPGVSFDFRYISAPKLTKVSSKLTQLAQNNIKHYGILNIMTTASKLEQVVDGLKDVFEAMKTIQQNDANRRTIIAMGLYDFDSSGAHDRFKAVIKKAVDTFKVDTVIAISSVSSIMDETACIAAPPVAIDAANKKFPALKKIAEVAVGGAVYTNPKAIVGLSYEMGAVTYELENAPSDTLGAVYAKCNRIGLTSLDSICERGEPKIIDSGVNRKSWSVAGFLTDDKKVAYLSETAGSFTGLLVDLSLLNIVFRDRMAWLVYNVHLDDHASKCMPRTKFLEDVCTAFKGANNC